MSKEEGVEECVGRTVALTGASIAFTFLTCGQTLLITCTSRAWVEEDKGDTDVAREQRV